MSLHSKLSLRPDEQILDIIRASSAHHLFRYILMMAMLGTNAFFTFWLWSGGIEGKVFNLLIWFLGLNVIITTYYGARRNILVVTDQRIFDIHRESWFKETISAVNFYEVEDIVISRRGILSSLFNFGIITVHPRQGKFALEIHHIPSPERVQDFLFEKRENSLKNIELSDKELVCSKFNKLIPQLSEAELTAFYQKIHRQLLKLAESSTVDPD